MVSVDVKPKVSNEIKCSPVEEKRGEGDGVMFRALQFQRERDRQTDKQTGRENMRHRERDTHTQSER